MKHVSNNKSTFLAIAFFVLMSLAGITTANAQQDNLSPLISTTGPNVMGEGHIQWNSSLEYFYQGFRNNKQVFNLNSFGANTGLRFGIGNRAELTLDLRGSLHTWNDIDMQHTVGFMPSVGAKLLLFDGKGWLPQTSFFTHVSYAVNQYAINPGLVSIAPQTGPEEWWEHMVQPEIGLQFRNRISGSWFLDYSIGYSWNKQGSAFSDPANLMQYSINARRLISNHHMVGVGIDNMGSTHSMRGNTEWRWLVEDNLQLQLQAGFSFGASIGSMAGNFDLVGGFSWTIQ